MPHVDIPGARRRGKPLTFADVQALAMTLPEVEIGKSYGTPALKVKGKLFARLHDDGETLILRTTSINREYLIGAWPREFYLTEHYRNHPWVLARLAAIPRARLAEVLTDAWELAAPAKVRARRQNRAPGQ